MMRLQQLGIVQAGKQTDHIFEFLGLALTDLGYGMVVKAEYDDKGNYAPTLSSVKDWNQPHIAVALADFRRFLQATPLAYYDLSKKNVVLSFRGGKWQIVIIDGIGVYRQKFLYAHCFAKKQKIPAWVWVGKDFSG